MVIAAADKDARVEVAVGAAHILQKLLWECLIATIAGNKSGACDFWEVSPCESTTDRSVIGGDKLAASQRNDAHTRASPPRANPKSIQVTVSLPCSLSH